MATEVGVRRSKKQQGWCIADELREHFTGGFKNGLLVNVKFDPNADAMQCVQGYDSTGEAIGQVESESAGALKLPDSLKRTAPIMYDSRARRFHEVEKPEETVTSADYLLLNADGSAIAGWK